MPERDETRVVLVKPGDVLAIGRAEGVDAEGARALGDFFERAGIRVAVFEQDIELGLAPVLAGADATPSAPGAEVTPGQIWLHLLSLAPAERLQVLARFQEKSFAAARCSLLGGHERSYERCAFWWRDDQVGDSYGCVLPAGFPHPEHWNPTAGLHDPEVTGA